METPPNSQEAIDRASDDAALRKFANDFAIAWYWTALGDKPGDEQPSFKDAIEATQRKKKELPTRVYNGLAALSSPAEGQENHLQILSLLNALSFVAGSDLHIPQDTLDLLRDPDSALWQSNEYLPQLAHLTKNIPAGQLTTHVVDIARHIANEGSRPGLVYRSYLGRLTTLLTFIQEYPIHTSNDAIFDDAKCRIADIRDGLRSCVLADIFKDDIPDADHNTEDYYAQIAQDELDALPAEAAVYSLLPIYYLKAVPGLTEDTYPAKNELDYPTILTRHHLSKLETNPHPATPTIGVELEIRKKPLLPVGFSEWTPEQRAEHLTRLYNRFEDTWYAGIPKDKTDKIAFYEFAFDPKNYYLTLSREVQMLQNRGFIPKSLRPPTMHITLGGINARLDESKENEVFALCRVMEATMWSSSYHRLLRSYPANFRTYDGGDASIGWDCKGLAGVLDKKYDEFYQYSTSLEMVEFRTFQFKSLEGTNRTLASFQTLGAAIGAVQLLRDAQNENLAIDTTGDDSGENLLILADIWHTFESKVKELFYAYGLDDPKKPYTPLQPKNDFKKRYEKALGTDEASQKSGFYALAELLKEAEKNPDSRGSEFVKEARKLVISTCGEIAPIIFSV